MQVGPRSRGAALAALLMVGAALLCAGTGLPPLGATEPPIRWLMAVLLAANMIWIAWGTFRLDSTAWLCAMLLFGATAAFTAATLLVGPRPPIAWAHAGVCAAILLTLAMPSVRSAFARARAVRDVPAKR